MGASLGGSGGHAGRRGKRRRHVPMSEINVTPFVDVMLVLLIIFMVAAPLLTAGVPLELPQAKGKALEANKQPIVVSVIKSGEVYLGEETKTAMPLDQLTAKLAVIGQGPGGFDQAIFVRGDKSVEYGHVLRVMARIKEAGFKKVMLVSEAGTGG